MNFEENLGLSYTIELLKIIHISFQINELINQLTINIKQPFCVVVVCKLNYTNN